MGTRIPPRLESRCIDRGVPSFLLRSKRGLVGKHEAHLISIALPEIFKLCDDIVTIPAADWSSDRKRQYLDWAKQS